MISLNYATIDTWVFDLDNTLYHPRCNLFSQIDVKMGEYIQRTLNVDAVRAREVQKGYFREHGTTLSGLMAHHGVAPHDFLDYVHDIDLSVVPEDLALSAKLEALPGRKLVFTNGDGPYARRVMAKLGIEHLFEGVHCIIDAAFEPKPKPDVYARVSRAFNILPGNTVFVEDMARNLKPAKDLGWKTVWIDNGSEWGSVDSGDYIDVIVPDIHHWLDGMAWQGIEK
jgi:putative hydrolase of the HAD superfamily